VQRILKDVFGLRSSVFARPPLEAILPDSIE